MGYLEERTNGLYVLNANVYGIHIKLTFKLVNEKASDEKPKKGFYLKVVDLPVRKSDFEKYGEK